MLSLAKHWSGEDAVCVMLGDNIFERSIRGAVGRFRHAGYRGARVLLAEVADPSSYGVTALADGRIVRIEERLAVPASRFAVTGCYLYDHRVFELTESLRPSARGELEVTDVNNHFISLGEIAFDTIPGCWADRGESFASYLRASDLVAEYGANRPEPT